MSFRGERMLLCNLLADALLDQLRHESGQGTAKLGDLPHDARAEVRVLFGGHHEHGLDPGFHLAVHQRHLQLELVVTYRANPSQHGIGIPPDTVGDQQALKNIDSDVVEFGGHRLQHLFALFHVEQGLVLVEIAGNRHDQPVEEFAAAMDQVQVSVRNRVERPGINSDDILQATSESGSLCGMILFWLASGGNQGNRTRGPREEGPFHCTMPYFRPAGGLGVACGAASALAAAACALSSTEIRPSDLRTSVSIFTAMSLFSFRNCLAFSRPWPMRSPL